MNKLILSIFLFFFASIGYADVHKYAGSDGSALLTNRKPQIRKDILSAHATEKDIVPNALSSSNEGVEYTYQGTKKFVPSIETVHIGTRDVYEQGWCKINNSIIPCYNYEKTLPATSFKVKSSKEVRVSSKDVLQEAIRDTEQNKK